MGNHMFAVNDVLGADDKHGHDAIGKRIKPQRGSGAEILKQADEKCGQQSRIAWGVKGDENHRQQGEVGQGLSHSQRVGHAALQADGQVSQDEIRQPTHQFFPTSTKTSVR